MAGHVGGAAPGQGAPALDAGRSPVAGDVTASPGDRTGGSEAPGAVPGAASPPDTVPGAASSGAVPVAAVPGGVVPGGGESPGAGVGVAVSDVVARAGQVATAVAAAAAGGDRAQWVGVVAACQGLVNTVSAVQDVAVVAVSRREGAWEEDGTLGEVVLGAGRVSVDAADVLAPALGASHAQAQRRVEAAVRLAGGADPVPARSGQVPQASGLGGLHAAMAAGVLDSYRASVVAAELVETPAPVAQAVVAALAGHWAEDGTDLRRRTRRLLARICPDLLRQRAVRARAACGLRRWVAEPGVDTWLGSFPSEDAAAAWAAVDQLAHRYVTEGVCAGVEAARGKALTDLVTGNATIDMQVVLTVPADAVPTDAVSTDAVKADAVPADAVPKDAVPADPARTPGGTCCDDGGVGEADPAPHAGADAHRGVGPDEAVASEAGSQVAASAGNDTHRGVGPDAGVASEAGSQVSASAGNDTHRDVGPDEGVASEAGSQVAASAGNDTHVAECAGSRAPSAAGTAAGQVSSPATDGKDEDQDDDGKSRTTAPDSATPAHVDRRAGADGEADAAPVRADGGVPGTAPHGAAPSQGACTTSTHPVDDDDDGDEDDDDRDAVADGGGAPAGEVGDAAAGDAGEVGDAAVEDAGEAGGALSGAFGGGRGDDLVQVQGCRPSEPLLVPRAWLLEHLAPGSFSAQPGHRHRRRRDGTPDRAGPTATAPVVAPVIAPVVAPCDAVSGARVDPGHALAGRAYRPSPALAALVRARDGRCRFPGCAVAARFCDLDHVRAWPGGPTTAENLMALCRRHHRVKQTPGWLVRLHPDATATWTDPTGTVRTTRPLDALAVLVLRDADHDSPAGSAGNPGTGHSGHSGHSDSGHSGHSDSGHSDDSGHSGSGSGWAAGPSTGPPAAGDGDGAVPAGAWSALQTHLELTLEHHPPPPHSFTVRPTHRRCTSTVLRAALARRRARTRFPDVPPF